ncbi:MAG: hypothetical protein F6J87_11780 [Spirulina sp. SIO3F2]|nr:hypothetical protein [Spirulina sp. SIO3F2]
MKQLYQWLIAGVGIVLLSLGSLAFAPPAAALTQVQLKQVGYRDCPPELAAGAVISMGAQSANCFLVTGIAVNPSGKYVVDADVFGRIYDANNNPVFQNRSRVGTIAEIPPGESEFEIRISVAKNQPLPLQLKQFKASGFASRVRPFYYDHEDDDFDFDSDFGF